MNWFNRNKEQQLCRTAIVGLCVLLILGGMIAPSHARSLAEIKQSKELRICIAPIHPAYATAEPAACRDKCKFTGPVYEESMIFAQSLGKGIQAKLLRVDWDEQFFNKDSET